MAFSLPLNARAGKATLPSRQNDVLGATLFDTVRTVGRHGGKSTTRSNVEKTKAPEGARVCGE